MTKEQRRARRDMLNPSRKTKPVKTTTSRRCRCSTGSCKKHGTFQPIEREVIR